MKRRDFLKTASAATTALSLSPVLKRDVFAQSPKSKVVIVKDTQCYVAGKADEAKIQEMVDQAIMNLTGQSVKAAAYEALFPKPVTSTTKIAIKYNGSSGSYNGNTDQVNTVKTPYMLVKASLIKGLQYMLNGKFPAANISQHNNDKPASSGNPGFTIGSSACKFQDPIVNVDYIINMPVCWATRSDIAGVSLSLKNMMGTIVVLGQPDQSAMHAYYYNAASPSLSIISSQPTLKNKQVLVLIDAILMRTNDGPFGNPTNTSYSIIASKDMVAADYQGMLLLKANGLPADRETAARNVFNLAATGSYKLGTNDPNNMDIVNLAPPYPDVTVTHSGLSAEKIGLRVSIRHEANSPFVHFDVDKINSEKTHLAVHALSGAKIWSSTELVWNCQTSGGGKVGRGTYLFVLSVGSETVRGQICISK